MKKMQNYAYLRNLGREETMLPNGWGARRSDNFTDTLVMRCTQMISKYKIDS